MVLGGPRGILTEVRRRGKVRIVLVIILENLGITELAFWYTRRVKISTVQMARNLTIMASTGISVDIMATYKTQSNRTEI